MSPWSILCVLFLVSTAHSGVAAHESCGSPPTIVDFSPTGYQRSGELRVEATVSDLGGHCGIFARMWINGEEAVVAIDERPGTESHEYDIVHKTYFAPGSYTVHLRIADSDN